MTNKVGVGKGHGTGNAGGYLYSAPIGTALPTDALTPLPSAYTPIALISEDGVTFGVTETTTDYRDWAGDNVLTSSSGRTETVAMSLIETSKEAMEMAFGSAAVSGTADKFTVDHKALDREARVYVWEIILSDTLIKRSVAPNGKVTSLSDITYAPGSLVSYPITVTAQKGDGVDFTIRDFVESVTSTSGYAEVTPEEGDNPYEEGWYVLIDGVYALTDDQEAESGKTYYARS